MATARSMQPGPEEVGSGLRAYKPALGSERQPPSRTSLEAQAQGNRVVAVARAGGAAVGAYL